MSRDVTKKFADKLRKIRKERALSQEDLAMLSNIDRTYIGRIERMERNPSLVMLQKLADGLEMELKDLLTFED